MKTSALAQVTLTVLLVAVGVGHVAYLKASMYGLGLGGSPEPRDLLLLLLLLFGGQWLAYLLGLIDGREEKG